MSYISSDTLTGEYSAQRRGSESSAANTAMICNILKFLEPSPKTLFENAPADSTDTFYEDNFEGFVSCLVSSNDEVRTLASALAKRLLAEDGILASLRKTKRLSSQNLRVRFWKLT
jgi:neurofibromin 1